MVRYRTGSSSCGANRRVAGEAARRLAAGEPCRWGAGEIAWIKHSAYESPHRDSRFDNSLAGMSGQPPFWLTSLKIFLWQEVAP